MHWQRRLLPLAVTLFALAGCSDLGRVVKPVPQSQLSATALDFGTVAVSQSVTRSLTVTNSGTGTLTGEASLSCAGYSLQSGGGPFALAGGQSRTIVVAFAPASVGTYPCTLDLGPNAAAVTISGEAALQQPGAIPVVLQTSFAFGPLDAGQTALATTEVINTGTAPLLVNVVSGCSAFPVIRGGGSATIPPGGSVAITIGFSPTGSGPVSCIIEVGPQIPTISVSGTGITASFQGDVRPFLAGRCGSCHFYLADPNIYTYITSPGIFFTEPLIQASDPDNSILYRKLTPTPPFGSRMPQGGPFLTASELDLIRRWIVEGALEN
jgi:hypothetical protein